MINKGRSTHRFGSRRDVRRKNDMNIPTEADFWKHSCRTWKRDRCQIWCSKGLWWVEARDEETAMREAMNYFIQYWNDGEYEPDDGLDDSLTHFIHSNPVFD